MSFGWPFFSATGSFPHPTRSIPFPPRLPLQGHYKITFRERHGALKTFPFLPPLAFFPGPREGLISFYFLLRAEITP